MLCTCRGRTPIRELLGTLRSCQNMCAYRLPHVDIAVSFVYPAGIKAFCPAAWGHFDGAASSTPWHGQSHPLQFFWMTFSIFSLRFITHPSESRAAVCTRVAFRHNAAQVLGGVGLPRNSRAFSNLPHFFFVKPEPLDASSDGPGVADIMCHIKKFGRG